MDLIPIKSFYELLYLDKNYNGKEVYIDAKHAARIGQLERDAIRFLYRHFKKVNI